MYLKYNDWLINASNFDETFVDVIEDNHTHFTCLVVKIFNEEHRFPYSTLADAREALEEVYASIRHDHSWADISPAQYTSMQNPFRIRSHFIED